MVVVLRNGCNSIRKSTRQETLDQSQSISHLCRSSLSQSWFRIPERRPARGGGIMISMQQPPIRDSISISDLSLLDRTVTTALLKSSRPSSRSKTSEWKVTVVDGSLARRLTKSLPNRFRDNLQSATQVLQRTMRDERLSHNDATHD